MSVDLHARRQRRWLSVSRWSAVLALGCALAACKKEEPAPAPPFSQTATPPASAAPPVTAATAISEKVTALSADQLRAAARKAYAENRLYSPTEDNAVEYYLALREKSPADAAVSSALTDLLPMTVIATEQSVAREDFAEAHRLAALLERADPQHPALVRLKASIAAQQDVVAKRTEQEALTAEEQAKKQEELEKKRQAEQKAQQEAAAQKLAQQQQTPAAQGERPAAPANGQAPRNATATPPAATPPPAPEPAAPEPRAAVPEAPPASGPVELRPVSTPAPRYPADALRAGQSGEVQVEFTVGTDGSVTAARVVRSNPARIFDREAVNAVRRWRFQPVDEPVTTRRTIGFNPGG